MKAVTANKQGVSYFAQGEFEKAAQAFQLAIDTQSDYADAYYNLGLALTKLQRRQEAMNAYGALLSLEPEHLGARFQLGCLWMQRDNDKKAIEYFLAIEKNHPQHVETLMNLAACYLRLGYINEAKSYYLKVLEITPEEALAYFNLGVIDMQLGRRKEAVNYYLQALKFQPDYYDAHNNLGVTYLALNDQAAALVHFRAALYLQPQNTAVRHTVDVLSQEKKLSNSPPEYIRSLFDSYAGHYDAHLLTSLNYDVPNQLLTLIKKHASPNKVDILDMGCGTGLTGEIFKEYANQLVGVDLSKNMLAIARQKNIYDELMESEVVEFLATKKEKFEWLVAGDVVVYFGDLEALISAAFQALKPNGFFVFNAEISPQEDFQMSYSGRFAHHQDYIKRIIEEHSFQLIDYQMATMRTHQGEAVSGHFYLLQKLC